MNEGIVDDTNNPDVPIALSTTSGAIPSATSTATTFTSTTSSTFINHSKNASATIEAYTINSPNNSANESKVPFNGHGNNDNNNNNNNNSIDYNINNRYISSPTSTSASSLPMDEDTINKKWIDNPLHDRSHHHHHEQGGPSAVAAPRRKSSIGPNHLIDSTSSVGM